MFQTHITRIGEGMAHHKWHPVSKKCAFCGKPIIAKHLELYCRPCFHLVRRMHTAKLSVKARKSIRRYLRKYGFICDYSGITLELNDFTGPWYCDFSCPDKRNKDKMVFAAALFSIMKRSLTKDQFKYYVLQLHDHRTKHTKIKKRPIIYWRLGEGGCCICGGPKLSKYSHFCATCSHIAQRMRDKRFSAKAIKAVWYYIRKYGYTCYYTGMPLELKDIHDPWYLVFDHANPRDSGKIVLTSTLVNAMKMDLTEAEFWYYIAQLADHFRKGTPVKKIKLKYWSRQYDPS